MQNNNASLVIGTARFGDPSLQALCDREGSATAWRHAFARHGALAPRQAQGAFAVAVRLDDGRVFLAVDAFSVHTLCYRLVAGTMHFAARADALAVIPPQAAVRVQAIFDYLYFHAIPSPDTVFEGVARLPPGTCVEYDGQRLQSTRWWQPAFEPPGRADFDALAEEFRQRVESAVRSRIGEGKPACFLSGGTDSSTVAGMIGQVAGRPAATYSIGFEAEGYDEMAYARIAARRFGTEHHEYYVTPEDLIAHVPAVARHYDQPFGNSSALPAYCCARFARDDGVTRLLAGDGGDELFGGNARYAKQRVFGLYGHVPRALRSGLLEPVLRGPLGGLPFARKGRSYVEQARVPLPDRLEMYNLLLRLGTGHVLEPGFLARLDPSRPLSHQQAVWAESDGAAALNRMLAFDWRYTLAESDLPKVRETAALAGVEVAFPFLDQALVDFSQRLPLDYKLRGLKLRWFFKEALRGFLPDEILTKRKQGFGLPFGPWVVRHTGLRALATDSLQSLAGRGIVRRTFIQQLLAEHLPAHPGYYGEMVWILMMLEQWLQQSPAASYRAD